MGYAEFEEKDFEAPLYNQLMNGKRDIWTPGQCFEAHLGIDFSGNVNSHQFWNKFGGYKPKGVTLSDYKMGYVLNKIKKRKGLPNFRMNLFIQAKRPYIHSGKRGSVYNIKHYSFDIKQEQQKVLERLNHKIKHRALLVYAAPVFGTYKELFKCTNDGTMISNTSFPKVSNLSGHFKWYYYDANNGIAHSDPEEQKTRNIFSLIDELKRENNNSNNTSYYENLIFLANEIIGTLAEFPNDVQTNSVLSQIREIQIIYENQLHIVYEEQDHYEYLYKKYLNTNNLLYNTFYAYDVIAVFCNMFYLFWFTL